MRETKRAMPFAREQESNIYWLYWMDSFISLLLKLPHLFFTVNKIGTLIIPILWIFKSASWEGQVLCPRSYG
jgi:hypothetical protein